jgi:hypothetical protein
MPVTTTTDLATYLAARALTFIGLTALSTIVLALPYVT